jgi:hypothetical protein
VKLSERQSFKFAKKMPPADRQLGAAEKGLSSSPDNKKIAPINVQNG